MAKLITGFTNSDITASDDQQLYKGIIGESNVVFNVGDNLALTVNVGDAAAASVGTGAFSFNGRIVRIPTAETINLSLPESGKFKKCRISARFSVNNSTNVESVSLVALYSDEASSAGALSSASINGANASDSITGSSSADFPLWEFILSSDNHSNETQLFTVSMSLEELNELIVSNRAAISAEASARANADIAEAAARANTDGVLESLISANAAALAKEARIVPMSSGQSASDFLAFFIKGTVSGMEFSAVYPNVPNTSYKVSVPYLNKDTLLSSGNTKVIFSTIPVFSISLNGYINTGIVENAVCYGIGRKA